MKRCRSLFALLTYLALAVLLSSTANAQLDIVLNPGSGLQNNAAALAAAQRAATRWEGLFTDAITVNIDIDFASLPGSTLSEASSLTTLIPLDTLRNELINDAATSGNTLITGAIPTAAQINTVLPTGGSFSGNVNVNTATLRAIDEDNSLNIPFPAGLVDGMIEINSSSNFDFDSSDGSVTSSGLGFDLETVIAHEIGHVLGFQSQVDPVDFDIQGGVLSPLELPGLNTPSIDISPLDLFRFETANVPTTLFEFNNNARVLNPGVASTFSDTNTNIALSTGQFGGDGQQASHFQDDEISGVTLGIFEPTFTPGQIVPITSNDILTLDLIGFNVASTAAEVIPEPSSFVVLAMIGLAVSTRRRR